MSTLGRNSIKPKRIAHRVTHTTKPIQDGGGTEEFVKLARCYEPANCAGLNASHELHGIKSSIAPTIPRLNGLAVTPSTEPIPTVKANQIRL